jgi:hypothetical protein
MVRQSESISSESGDINPRAIRLIENINTLILEEPFSYMHIAEKLCELKQLAGHGNWLKYKNMVLQYLVC